MSGFGDIIPIASRRPSPPALTLAPPEAKPSDDRGGIVGLLLIMLVIVGVGGAGLLAQTHAEGAVARVVTNHRDAIFARAHDDLLETCRLPEAAEGPIRDHCVATAAFVLLFPECDADCGRLARELQPHARR
jgi:hypothetical protein